MKIPNICACLYACPRHRAQIIRSTRKSLWQNFRNFMNLYLCSKVKYIFFIFFCSVQYFLVDSVFVLTNMKSINHEFQEYMHQWYGPYEHTLCYNIKMCLYQSRLYLHSKVNVGISLVLTLQRLLKCVYQFSLLLQWYWIWFTIDHYRKELVSVRFVIARYEKLLVSVW